MKEKFIEIFKQNIARPGSDKLLAWLETTDFFEAPASTRFHLSRPGGLVEHSIHVYERLLKLYISEKTEPGQPVPYFPMAEELETITICGLLHDLCKANFYGVEMRNRKNEQGQWEKYPFYVVNDQLPYGHGEKSVYIISGFMKLSREEAMAIRRGKCGSCLWYEPLIKNGKKTARGACTKGRRPVYRQQLQPVCRRFKMLEV